MKRHLLFVLIISFSNCFSQELVKGRLLDDAGKGIAYANIGIANSSVGTLSNEDGTFQILISPRHNNDTLLFSALGYERQSIVVRSLAGRNEVVVRLKEKITTLKPVEVSARKGKQKSYSLGNRYTKGGFLYADSVSAGAAMALLIENKYPSYHAELAFPFSLSEISLFIDKNSIDNFKLRVRFFERDPASGQPSKDLFSENVIVTSSIRKGWIDIDMRPYNLMITEPFYLAIEWIMDDRDRLALLNQYATFRKTYPDKVRSDSTVVEGKKIGFWSYLGFSPGTHLGVSPIPFSLQNYTCYYRTNSFGEWKRSPVILTARVSVTQ